jgi:GNAT superfamily N-acetyltransferase
MALSKHDKFPGMLGFIQLDLRSKKHRKLFSKLCTRAFFDNAVGQYLTASEKSKLRRSEKMDVFHDLAMQLFGRFGWVYADEKLRSVVLLTPPGAHVSTLGEVWAIFKYVLFTLFVLRSNPFTSAKRMAGFAGMIKEMHDKCVPEEMCDKRFYLNIVAVDPDWQRRGLGTAAVKPILDYCDKRGYICYLEADDPESKAFWEGLGFEQKGDIMTDQGFVYEAYLYTPKT